MGFHWFSKRLLCGLLIVAAALLRPGTIAAQGPIARIEGLFHQPIPPKAPAAPRQPNYNSSSNNWNISNGAGGGEALLGLLALLGAGVTSPFWVPAVALDAGYEQECGWPRYPYMNDKPGFAIIGESRKSNLLTEQYWDNPLFVKGWSVRSSLDYGNDFNGLNRLGGDLFLDTNFWRLGFLGHFNYSRESEDGSRADALIVDANVTFRTVQNEWMFLHVGLGGRMWTAYGDAHGGVNALYRGDFFPLQPLHLTTLAEVGNLDRLLFLHFQANLGFTWRHGELFIGYDFTRVSRVNLQGPAIGLRLWF